MNLFKTPALLSALFIMGSCSSADDVLTAEKRSVNVFATVSNTSASDTRASADLIYSPTGGTLHLFHNNVGNAQSATFVCTAQSWTTAFPLYWDDLPIPAKGNYTFYAVSPSVPVASPATSADQRVAKAYTTSDQLVARTTTSNYMASLPLAFKHILSQLKVTLTAAVEAGSPDYLNPASATLSIGGVRTAYTISYAGATASIPAVATVAKAAVATSVKPHAKSGSFFTIAPAQTFAAGTLTLSFIIDGKPYNWRNETVISTVAAKNTEINLKVKKSGITLTSAGVGITDWSTDGNPTDDDISFGK